MLRQNVETGTIKSTIKITGRNTHESKELPSFFLLYSLVSVFNNILFLRILYTTLRVQIFAEQIHELALFMV